jgi:hypothetical protein
MAAEMHFLLLVQGPPALLHYQKCPWATQRASPLENPFEKTRRNCYRWPERCEQSNLLLGLTIKWSKFGTNCRLDWGLCRGYLKFTHNFEDAIDQDVRTALAEPSTSGTTQGPTFIMHCVTCQILDSGIRKLSRYSWFHPYDLNGIDISHSIWVQPLRDAM